MKNAKIWNPKLTQVASFYLHSEETPKQKPPTGCSDCETFFYRHSTPTGCEEVFFFKKSAFKRSRPIR